MLKFVVLGVGLLLPACAGQPSSPQLHLPPLLGFSTNICFCPRFLINFLHSCDGLKAPPNTCSSNSHAGVIWEVQHLGSGEVAREGSHGGTNGFLGRGGHPAGTLAAPRSRCLCQGTTQRAAGGSRVPSEGGPGSQLLRVQSQSAGHFSSEQ